MTPAEVAPASRSAASPRNVAATAATDDSAAGRFGSDGGVGGGGGGGGAGGAGKRGKTPTEAMSLQEQAILANIQELQRQLWKVKSEQEKRESEEAHFEEDNEGVSERVYI